MSALTVGDWRVADATETGVRRECSGLVAAHLQWHLERALRSLPLVDRGGGPSAPGARRPAGDAGARRPTGDAGTVAPTGAVLPPDRASQDVSRETTE
ncbi:hypothetical protein GCM10029963_62930 [Micromonospora andamanensis]